MAERRSLSFAGQATDPSAAASKVLADRSNSAKSVLLRILSMADYRPFTAAAVSALIRPAANAAGTPHRLSADEKAGREAACRPAPSSSLQPARRCWRLGNWLRSITCVASSVGFSSDHRSRGARRDLSWVEDSG